MNRFPKMSVLWAVYFWKKGAPEPVAAALGYGMATLFAVLKGRAFPKGTKKKKRAPKQQTLTARSRTQEKPLLEPPTVEGWDAFKDPAIPITGQLFYKTTRNEVYVWLGKEIPGYSKYVRQIELKFGGKKRYMAYVKFAEHVIEQIGLERFASRWYEKWKEIRDLEWDQMLPQPELFKSA